MPYSLSLPYYLYVNSHRNLMSSVQQPSVSVDDLFNINIIIFLLLWSTLSSMSVRSRKKWDATTLRHKIVNDTIKVLFKCHSGECVCVCESACRWMDINGFSLKLWMSCWVCAPWTLLHSMMRHNEYTLKIVTPKKKKQERNITVSLRLYIWHLMLSPWILLYI